MMKNVPKARKDIVVNESDPSFKVLVYLKDSAIKENIEGLHCGEMFEEAKWFIASMEVAGRDINGAVEITARFEDKMRYQEARRKRHMNALVLLIEAGVLPY